MEIKNMMRNIVPSIAVMVIGLVGAYFVYNVYFSDKAATTATSVATFEPAAGEDHVGMTVAEDAALDTMESTAAEGEGMDDAVETTVEDAVEYMSGEVMQEGEAAVEDAHGAMDSMDGVEEITPSETMEHPE